MIKMIEFLKKKPGLSDEEFRQFYENGHAKLIERIEGLKLDGLLLDYRRNYVMHGYLGQRPSKSKTPDGRADYDCVTEMTFPDEAALKNLQQMLTDPGIRAMLIEDEEKFLDRSATRIVVCDEAVSDLEWKRKTRA